MEHINVVNATCTAQGKRGQFCERASLPTAPFPICLKHASLLMEFMTDCLAGAVDQKLLRLIELTDKPPRVVAPRGGHVDDTVYYLRVGPLVKIGYTHNLVQRLQAYPPHAVLLATEPGDRALEKQRHRQFVADRAERVEWFAPSAELIDHINTLRDEPLTAADLAA